MEIATLKSKIENTISCNAKVGLILLATDQITLYEFAEIFKDTKILYFPARVMNAVNITPQTLLKIKDELAQATNRILPGITLDVVAFSCTSASMTIGNSTIAKIIKKSDKKRKINAVTNPYLAIEQACNFLNIKELGLITPYADTVNQIMIDKIQNLGIKIKAAASFKIPNDNTVPYISTNSITKAVIKMAKNTSAGAIFVSCTNLNICRYIQKLESTTKKIILTSNQTMAWDILRLAKYKQPIFGFGVLLEKIR